jgi:hypothetical protein
MAKEEPTGKSRRRRTTTKKNNIALSGRSRKRRLVLTSIPPLKYSFDTLELKVTEILKNVQNPGERLKKFQAAWKEIFGRPVERVAAEAYLLVKTKPHYGKTRKQSGGAMPIAGATLDFQTRPGIDGVHGSFPPYLGSGLSFYNTINQDQLNKGVGLSAFEPAVPVDMGSNLAGGGVLSDALFLGITRPVPSEIPPNPINDAQTFMQGRSLPPSPDASQNPLKYM